MRVTTVKNMIKRWFRLGIVFGLLVLLFQVAGCGGASPPIGIPAPVSNLMIIDGPDAFGTTTILGAPGAVLPDAVVSGANTTLGGQARWWEYLFYGIAEAQGVAQPAAPALRIEREVISASDGSFRMRLTARPGDMIQVVQIVGGMSSPGTDIVVPNPPPKTIDPTTTGSTL